MMVLKIITGCLIINVDLIFCYVINGIGQNSNNINLTNSIKTNGAKKLDLNEDEFNLLILHMNDMHSRILETTVNSAPFCREKICYGGFSRVKLVSEQFKETYKSQNWSVLFLNAGDNFQGSPFYNLFKWKVLADLIPDLGFDVMTLGNHEFDDGVELLSDYLSNLKAPPTIVCNFDTSNETSFKNISINRSKIFTMKGRQIAVVGYLTPDTVNMGEVRNITIKNEIDCLKSEVSKLKASNVDIIIALGHSGYEMDKQIAAEVPSIDLVVGGHSHTFLWNGDKAPSIENISGNYPTWIERNSNGIDPEVKTKVPVVQSYAYTKYLGLLKMSFSITNQSQFKLKSAEGNPILLSSENYNEDPVMNEKIKKWKKEVDKKYSQVIGNTKVHLNGDGRICRNQECNLGNLIADSFIDYGKRHNVTDEGTYIAFVHSGSIRSNIDPPDGNIQYGDLLSALPYSNKLVQIKVKGEDLYQIFEHSVSAIQNNLGRFLQVSGLRVQYNRKNPAGNRVKSIVVNCKFCNSDQFEPVLRKNEYNVVTVDHILKGGDDFRSLNDSHIVQKNLNTTDFEAALEYLTLKSPILPEIQNRITFVN